MRTYSPMTSVELPKSSRFTVWPRITTLALVRKSEGVKNSPSERSKPLIWR